jgi:dTDP-4-amino-4,6-dideoxygalactose transaminase
MANPRIYLSSPHMGPDELGLVQEAFATNWIAPLGPHVDAFERELAARVGEGRLLVDGSSLLGAGSSPSPATNNPITSNPITNNPVTNNPITSNPVTDNLPPLHAAALSSGTAALHLAMRWLGVQRGDEVICSSLTFSATVNPVLYEGGTPVFVDSDATSWNMDPSRLAEALEDAARRGKKPKAVVLVHLYGQSADLDPIVELCRRHEVPLVEDAAEALGATYFSRSELLVTGSSLLAEGRAAPATSHQPATSNPARSTDDQEPMTDNPPSVPRRGIAPGTAGLCGVYSFNGNKIITTSGGGALVSADQALIEKAKFWATQARDPAPHYQHSEVGFNYRMSNVLAGIGRGQLRVLSQRVDARRANCAFYQQAFADLPGVSFMPEAPFGRCTRWLTCITIDPAVAGTDRERVRLALAEQNIEARPVWKPMHLQPIFAGTRCYGGAVSERLFDHGLCLPSGSNLSQADLDRVATAFRRCFGR